MTTPEPLATLFEGAILYVLPIPGEDEEQTPFQAFSQGACDVMSLLRLLPTLPASIYEFTMDAPTRVESIAEGLLKFHVLPVNHKLLSIIDFDERHPFCVVLSSKLTDAAVRAWLERARMVALHTTTAADGAEVCGGALQHEDVRAYVERRLGSLYDQPHVGELAKQLLGALRPRPAPSRLDFPRTSHNIVFPNEAVLERVGYQFVSERRFDANKGDDQVVDAILRAAREVIAARGDASPWVTPSMVLATAARSRAMEEIVLEQASSRRAPRGAKKISSAVKGLRAQQGYFQSVAVPEQLDEGFYAVQELRARELHAYTDVLAVRCASELSAFVRFPQSIGRAASIARNVATCYRGRSGQRAEKLFRLMAALSQELRDNVPERLRPLLDVAPTSIRIVSDLPLEWYPLSTGERLIFRHSCSRIPPYPGNIFVQHALPAPNVHLSIKDLTKVLILRSLEKEDPLYGMLAAGLSYLKEVDGIELSIVDVSTLDDVVGALQSFDGAWLIFDGHGQKTEGASGLVIGGKTVDLIGLRGRVRIPPIVFPLACDVHPLDTSHSSAAVAFLAAGARVSVGTLLPVEGRKATGFLVRLLRAAHELLPMLFGKSAARTTWSELFSIILRSQFVHEVAALFVPRVGWDALTPVIAMGSTHVMAHDPNWHPRFFSELASVLGMKSRELIKLVDKVLPVPDCSLYLQLGDPESIIIHSDADLETLAGAARDSVAIERSEDQPQ